MFKKNNPGCKCCNVVDCQCSTVPLNCDGCTAGGSDQPPTKWTLTVSGTTNGTCTDCGNYNGDWVLCYQDDAPTCTWQTTDTGDCAAGTEPRYKLVYNSAATRWEVRALAGDGTIMASWALAKASWKCRNTNTLPNITTTTDCNWPATVTVVPCKQCDQCTTGTAPAQVQIDVSGVVNGACSDCYTDVNGTFVLDSNYTCVAGVSGPPSLAGGDDCNFAWVSIRVCDGQLFNERYYCWVLRFTSTGPVLWLYYAGAQIVGRWSLTLSPTYDCSSARSLTWDPPSPQPAMFHCQVAGATITMTPL